MKVTPQNVIDEIEGKMVFFKDGINQIALGNYALDFKQSYAFLGFTKNKSQVILGQITTYGATNQDGTRTIGYNKKYGKIVYETKVKPIYVPTAGGKFAYMGDGSYGQWRIVTDGYRYSETILEVKI